MYVARNIVYTALHIYIDLPRPLIVVISCGESGGESVMEMGVSLYTLVCGRLNDDSCSSERELEIFLLLVDPL